MDSKILNSKCIKCSGGFVNTERKTVQCIQCTNHLNLKCVGLNKNTYQSFIGDQDFSCQYCSHQSCILMRSMCMINKAEFFVMAVIYGLIDGVLE